MRDKYILSNQLQDQNLAFTIKRSILGQEPEHRRGKVKILKANSEADKAKPGESIFILYIYRFCNGLWCTITMLIYHVCDLITLIIV